MAAAADQVVAIEDDQVGFTVHWQNKFAENLGRFPAGPCAFLESELRTEAEYGDFMDWLWKEFPESSDILYQHSKSFHGVTEEQLAQHPPSAFHVSAFAFDDRSSMKPAPGKEQAIGLAEHIMKHGFITSGDPILAQHQVAQPMTQLPALWEKPSDGECLAPFSVAFIKGRARISTLMALLYTMFEGGAKEISENHRLLWESVCVIWTQHYLQHTKEEEVLANLKLSLRGSLRKACNVIQIAHMVRKLLKEGGTDYGSFVRKWNGSCVASQQIKGRKATSLKLLVESAPQDVLDSILTHVGLMGWAESSWTEENLASKRIFPGHSFTSRSRKWIPRLKVTDESLRVMVQRVQWMAENWRADLGKRPVYDVAFMESMSEKAAALCGLIKEFCKEHPVSPQLVSEKILQPWANGDERIEMELVAALLEKSDQFEVGLHMACFKALLDDAIFKAPVSSDVERNLRDQLKRDEFDSLIKKLDYDTKVFEIWQSKCAGVTVARNHARQEHIINQHRKIHEAVENYLDTCIRLITWEGCRSVDSLIPQILQYHMDVMKKLKSKVAANEVPTVTLVNWTAPSLLAQNRHSDHAGILSWAMHDNPNSCALIFSPIFSNQKGRTFLEENAALQLLSRGGHNLDHQFSLLYQERCDLRDGRPLLYPWRFAFPGHVVDLQKSSPFFQSELRKSARTETCKQVPAKDLKDIEDVTEDAIPCVTHAGYVTGAAKYSQFGVPAAEEILKKVFQGVQLDNVQAVLLIDVHPRVGDFTHAFCKLRSHLGNNTSLFYLAICEKGKDMEWMRLTLLEDLVDKAKNGQMMIPGLPPVQVEVSPDLLQAVPALPVMNLLAAPGEGEFKKLKIPHSLVKKWRTDCEFGDEFGKWLDNFLETYSVTEEDSQMPPPRGDPSKSPPGGAGNDSAGSEPGPSAKKLKVEEVAAEHIVKNDGIQEALLFDVKISGKDSMSFQIRAGKKLYLVNLTGQELSMKPAAALVGFGRGNFKLFKEDEALPEKAIRFDVSKPNSMVCLNGQVMSISEVVHQHRARNPEAQVSYHKTTLVAETPGQYKFELTKVVAFIPADRKSKPEASNAKKEDGEESTLAATNIAARESPGVFEGLHCCNLVWWVRWTVRGLQPIKPMIHLNKRLVLPVGQACQLTS